MVRTENLLKQLDKGKNLDKYLKDNKEEFLPRNNALGCFIEKTLKEKNLKASEVIKNAGLEGNNYFYEVKRGEKNPGKDELVLFAFGMQLNYEETQRLLKIGDAGALYPHIRRDSIIISSIKNNKKSWECDWLLDKEGEEPLMKNRD